VFWGQFTATATSASLGLSSFRFISTFSLLICWYIGSIGLLIFAITLCWLGNKLIRFTFLLLVSVFVNRLLGLSNWQQLINLSEWRTKYNLETPQEPGMADRGPLSQSLFSSQRVATLSLSLSLCSASTWFLHLVPYQASRGRRKRAHALWVQNEGSKSRREEKHLYNLWITRLVVWPWNYKRVYQ
jgi:hypothetical protein